MSADPRIRIVLAFDHELSLGGAPDYDRNLFDPTRKLMAMADALGVRIVLFTDVLCAVAHERWNVPAFVEPYRASLLDAVGRGHDVQLHLHPHWLTSRWENGTFVPSHDFGLGCFTVAGRETIEQIVHTGAEYLRSLCLQSDSGYSCIAFRAGGYNLAPETERILRALHAEGVRIDSSIIKGFRFSSGLHAIDFTAMTARANWYIPLDGPLNASSMGGLFEVPIASAPRTPVNNMPFLARRVVHRSRRHSDGGRGIHDGATSRIGKIRRLFPASAWPLCFDNYADDGKDVFAVLQRHVQAHAHEREIICASVSHPKSMGPHALHVFRDFVERVRRAYGQRVSFETFPDIYASLRVPARAV